jgi:hypothetical protein
MRWLMWTLKGQMREICDRDERTMQWYKVKRRRMWNVALR